MNSIYKVVIFTDNINDIINKIKNNSEKENKELARKLTGSLSSSQSNALSELLSDKKLVAELMKTPEAQKILKGLQGDKNGSE